MSPEGGIDMRLPEAPLARTAPGALVLSRAAAPAPIARLDLDARLGGAPPDRLTLAVLAFLAAPGILFLMGWAAPGAGAVAGGAGLWALSRAAADRRGWPLAPAVTVLCLLLGLAWAAGTGAHHLVYSTADWQVRDAVLRDLAMRPWPIAYSETGAGTWLLRAPLGFFLPAGLVGRVLGQPVAQAALWLWCGLGLGLVLALLAALGRALDPARPGRAAAVLAGVFVLFQGLDILPNLVLDGTAGAGVLAAWGRGGEWWDRLFQYSGHVTALLWAPNHALPAWLLALLLLRHVRTAAFARLAALPLAAAAFWSPIAAAGAALLTLVALAGHGTWRAALAAPGNWLAAVFALPLCLYLTAGASAVPHGPLLAVHPPVLALGRWIAFLTVEVLPWAVPVALLVRGGVLMRGAVALLCLLPLYVFGPGNEMASRGGMAALAVLAVAAGAALLAGIPRDGRRLAALALRGVAALALAGAVMEASLLVTRPAWPASRACSVPEAAHQSVFDDSTDWSHYLTPWPDPMLRRWLEQPELRALPPPDQAPRCWPAGRP